MNDGKKYRSISLNSIKELAIDVIGISRMFDRCRRGSYFHYDGGFCLIEPGKLREVLKSISLCGPGSWIHQKNGECAM